MESVLSGTLVGSILGFIFNLVQQWFQNRQGDVSTTGTNGSVTDGEIEGCVSGRDDLPYEPVDLHWRHKWLDFLRGATRPVLTLGFFGAWIGIKLAILIFAIQQAPAVSLPPVFWNVEDEILMSTAMSYWFSSRMWRLRTRS